ncbi:unnamed protein product (mitochondrion) [Musa textilis]
MLFLKESGGKCCFCSQVEFWGRRKYWLFSLYSLPYLYWFFSLYLLPRISCYHNKREITSEQKRTRIDFGIYKLARTGID